MAYDEAWDRAKQILCVRLDSLGDVLMTTPAIRALREGLPGRHITLLTSGSGAAVASIVPEVDETIVYDPPWMKHTSHREGPEVDAAMIEQLRARSFDAAAIFTVSTQNPLPSAFLCYMAGIPLRLAHCRENPYQLLTTWVEDLDSPAEMRHEVQRQLDLVATVGCVPSSGKLSLQVPAGARDRARALLGAKGLDLEREWVAVHPGATAASRRYPPELFAQAIDGLRDEGLQVVLTGEPEERGLVEGIREASRATTISVVGEANLATFAGVVSLAPLLISNNTGPVHVAAALGTPVVDIYALTNPQHTPWQVPHRLLTHDVPCRNCLRSVCPEGHHNCLRLIPPSAIVEAALSLLSETRTRFTPLPLPAR